MVVELNRHRRLFGAKRLHEKEHVGSTLVNRPQRVVRVSANIRGFLSVLLAAVKRELLSRAGHLFRDFNDALSRVFGRCKAADYRHLWTNTKAYSARRR
jgi:hypothetical protein